MVHNIFIWGINKDDGTSDDIVTQADALELIATLNIEYNKFNMFFKFHGFDYINETDIYIPQSSGAIHSYVNQNPGFEQQDAINFYIPYEFGSGAAGYGGGRRAFASKQYLIPYTIIHEIGHVFTLSHIFSGVGGSNCEHVTREQYLPNGDLNPDFNADVAGDRVVDTAACDTMRGPANVGPDCEYVANGADCQNNPFEIDQEPKNYMGYNEIRCVDHLTPGQGIRMREEIAMGTYTFAENTIASLYEPYKGEYYLAGPLPVDDDGRLNPPLFQPGFKYKFVECSGPYPQPADFNDTSFPYNVNTILLDIDKDETNYNSITHPNHSAIFIVHHDLVNNPYPRKCYNNYNLSPSGGSITKFNDNVLNTNVTITPQDSISINEQNLLQQLPSGLYKIEKDYPDGTKQETVIYKDNN